MSDLVTINVALTGRKPGLMMGNPASMDEASSSKKGAKVDPDKESEAMAYRVDYKNEESPLALPWRCLFKAICDAGSEHKSKRRGSARMCSLIAAAVTCEDEMIPLLDQVDRAIKKFSRFDGYCKIPPRTGAMVKVARPLVPEWTAKFALTVDVRVCPTDALAEILATAGKIQGVGRWRPSTSNPGPYGRFDVTQFEIAA